MRACDLNSNSYASPQLCKAANSSVVVCLSPVWPYEAGHILNVSLSRVVSAQPTVLVPGRPPLHFYADTSNLCPTVGGAWSGVQVAISGYGFVHTPGIYFCQWAGQTSPCSPVEFFEVEAHVVNGSLITCQLGCHQSEPEQECMDACLAPFNASCSATICEDACMRRCTANFGSAPAHGQCLQDCADEVPSAKHSSGTCLTQPWFASAAGRLAQRWRRCASQCSGSASLWLHPAMPTNFSLQERGPGQTRTVQQTEFSIFAQLKTSIPTGSGCGRTHVITIIGAGFDPFRRYPSYFCSVVGGGPAIVHESALANATDSRHVLCKMPPRDISTRAIVTLMQLPPEAQATGSRQNATAIPLARRCVQGCNGDDDASSSNSSTTSLPYFYYPQILSIEPTWALAIYGCRVNVTGAGFAPFETYIVRFSRYQNDEMLYVDSPAVQYVSPERLETIAPIWPSDWHAGAVNVTLHWPGDEALPGALSFSYHETVSAIVYCPGKASGDFIDIAGYALIGDDPVYHCTVSAVANHSRSVRGRNISTRFSSSILCDFPQWPYPAEPVHVQVWRAGKEIKVSPALVRQTGPLQCSLNPVWWGKSIPRKLSFNGGERITVNAFGLDPHGKPSADLEEKPCATQGKWLDNLAQMQFQDYREFENIYECGSWVPNYECRFTEVVRGDVAAEFTVSTGGVAMNSSTLLCSSTLWLGEQRESRLSVHACDVSADAAPLRTLSGTIVLPGSPIRGRIIFSSPQERVAFDRSNKFGIAGLACERLLDQVGPWSGELVFTEQPSILDPGTTPNAPVRGNPSITLAGLNFGYKDASPLARVIDSGCTSTRWISETTLVCGVAALGPYPYQVQSGHWTGELVVTVARYRTNSRTQAFTYDGPMFIDVARNLHTQTCLQLVETRSISLFGKDLAVVDVTVRARAGGTGCEHTIWTSTSTVLCRNAVGKRSTYPAVVSVQYTQHLDTVSDAFSFDVMTASGCSGTNRHGTGASSLTIHGTAFGQIDITPHLRVGSTSCASSLWHSDTTITTLATRGSWSSRRVSLTAFSIASSLSMAFSVDRIAMSEVVSGNRPGTGALSVTVIGMGFGSLQNSAQMRSAQTQMDFSIWTSDTAVRCSIVSGVRATRRVLMTVGLDLSGSFTSAFSYHSVPIRSAAARIDLGVRTPPPIWYKAVGDRATARWASNIDACPQYRAVWTKTRFYQRGCLHIRRECTKLKGSTRWRPSSKVDASSPAPISRAVIGFQSGWWRTRKSHQARASMCLPNGIFVVRSSSRNIARSCLILRGVRACPRVC